MSLISTGTVMERITDALSVLTVNVKLHNSRGRTDINKDAEDFYCGLLNLVLGVNLKNLNLLEMDFPAIDLADGEKRLCVQVSSTEGRDKVNRTLEKFFGNGLQSDYDRLIVLLIGDKPAYRKPFQVPAGFRFDPREDIWDRSKLLSEIEKLDGAARTAVDDYLCGQMRLERRPGKHLVLPMESALQSEGGFVGRARELAELTQRFRREQTLVLSGLGGMGKTELAVRFGTELEKTGRGWSYFVRFSGDFRQTLRDNVCRGIPGFTPQGKTEEQIIREALDALMACGPEDLLILDNADEGSITRLRRELSRLPMKVLVTTRQDTAGAVKVLPLDREELYAVFQQNEVDISRQEMDALIEAVDFHTLTVNVMAKTLRRGRRSATPEKLLRALKGRDLSKGFTKVEIEYAGSPEQARINDHLKAVFRVAELQEEAQALLRCATLLPAGGMGDELFLSPFDEDAGDTLDDLIEGGWLYMEEGLLRIHPIIRIVCIEVLKPDDKSCKNFLFGLRTQYNWKDYNHKKYRQLAELLTEASGTLADPDGFWANEAGFLWLVLSEPQRALNCNLLSVEKKEKHQPETNNLAAGYNNVGSTYGALGDHQKQLEYNLKALEILERVLPEDHPNLAASYNNVGMTYGDLGDHQKELEYMLKALEIRKRVLPEDHPDLAQIYNNVGMTYGNLGDHRKALEYNLKALEIRERVLPEDHPDLAASCNNVGYVYGNLGDHQKALEYNLKALKIWERVLPEDHPNLAASYHNVGYTYSALGDHPKALEYNLKALEIRERVLPWNHPNLARSCNNIAWIYYQLGQLGQAAAHMRRAAEIINASALPEGHPHRVNFNNWANLLEQEARQAAGKPE